jgi:quercetin dioxygenase-like cupin family protein
MAAIYVSRRVRTQRTQQQKEKLKMSTQLLTQSTQGSNHLKQRLPDGNVLEFLATPDQAKADICLMRATVPPGAVVPLHSHSASDVELIYILEGSLESYLFKDGTAGWTTVGMGDLVTIPGNTKHAWRNTSGFPATVIVVTTSRMYAFFRELAKPFDPDQPASPPTRQEIQEIFEVAARYGYWMGSPEENTAIGLIV